MKFQRACGIATLAVALGPTTAIAAPPGMLPTALPDTFTYPTPPDGFDALHASDDALRQYGFPVRPNPFHARKAYAVWAHVVGAAKIHVDPTLAVSNVRHRAMMSARGIQPQANAQASQNWSGEALTSSATSFGNSSFYALWVEYNVPIGQQAFGVCTGGNDVSATWIGMDGVTGYSTDVVQAGTESDAFCVNGTTTANYYAWYEWAPAYEVRITNMIVAPGDDIGLEVAAASATSASMFFTNETTNHYTSVQFSPPAGTQFVGNSAEWIMERPTINGKFGTLMNYVTQFMYNNVSLFDPGSPQGVWGGGGAANIPVTDITMYVNGAVVSAPTTIGIAGLQIQAEGAAK